MWNKVWRNYCLLCLLYSVGKSGAANMPDESVSNGTCLAEEACKEGLDSSCFTRSRHTGSRTRSFHDFVFVIECPCSKDGSSLDLITDSVSTWLQLSLSHPDHHYDRAAIVVFSSQSAASDVTVLSPLHPNLTGFITTHCGHTCSSSQHEPFDSSSSDYHSIGRALQLITGILTGGDIQTITGTSKRLYLRPHADTHLISLTGLSDTSQSSKNQEQASMQREVEELISRFIQDISLSRTALYFFINMSSRASSLIGSPKHAHRYSDCTHFNKALTLSALIKAGDNYANSLQAHLLSKGTMIQVSDLCDFSNIDCLRNLSPSLWSQFSLQTTFEDKCMQVKSCPSGMICSPLHGCIIEDAVDSSSGDEDKAPLPTHFSTSHADIAMSSSLPHSRAVLSDSLSITDPPSTTSNFTFADVVVGSPEMLLWEPDKPFVQHAMQRGVPLVLKNTVVATWPARKKWTLSYVKDNISDLLIGVKCTNTSLTFDPDQRVPLKLNLTLPYTLRNMSKEEFLECLNQEGACSSDSYNGHYYFGSVPKPLKADLKPDKLLYNTEKDYSAGKQFMWLSSPGMITHGHFDQDFNFFVQLIGEKRFTLWPPSQHELLSVFPRIHPLWHKSRINFRAPDLIKFPLFGRSRALQVTVGPGDVLYIPPYTWHYVETLSPSVSLSTWSHDYYLYEHMRAIYRHDHKFDLIGNPRGRQLHDYPSCVMCSVFSLDAGQMFALRMYLDMLVHDLYGYNETSQFFARLLKTRFSGLEHLFPPTKDEAFMCASSVPGKIPTCAHVHGYVKLDMVVVGGHFQTLPTEVMDLLFLDYVEEITAQVVGVRKMVAFFRYCFMGQTYYVTELGEDEHSLWDHSDRQEDQ